VNYRYEIRWTQRRGKAHATPAPHRGLFAAGRSTRALADALKDNAGMTRNLPKRISITLGSKDKGPARVEWLKQ
jgi:hypothetical protein